MLSVVECCLRERFGGQIPTESIPKKECTASMLFSCQAPTIERFRLEYQYEIEYEYDFRISK